MGGLRVCRAENAWVISAKKRIAKIPNNITELALCFPKYFCDSKNLLYFGQIKVFKEHKYLCVAYWNFYGVTSPDTGLYRSIDEFLFKKMLSSDLFLFDEKSLIPVALEIYRSTYLSIYRSIDLPIYLWSCNIWPIWKKILPKSKIMFRVGFLAQKIRVGWVNVHTTLFFLA